MSKNVHSKGNPAVWAGVASQDGSPPKGVGAVAGELANPGRRQPYRAMAPVFVRSRSHPERTQLYGGAEGPIAMEEPARGADQKSHCNSPRSLAMPRLRWNICPCQKEQSSER